MLLPVVGGAEGGDLSLRHAVQRKPRPRHQRDVGGIEGELVDGHRHRPFDLSDDPQRRKQPRPARQPKRCPRLRLGLQSDWPQRPQGSTAEIPPGVGESLRRFHA